MLFLQTKKCIHDFITLKIVLYVSKILNGLTPGYLTELLSIARCLKSSNDTTLWVLHLSATAIGDKRYQTVAAKSWNLLPTDIRTVTSVVTFKKLLKTYPFWLSCFWLYFCLLCKHHGTLVNGTSKCYVLLLLLLLSISEVQQLYRLNREVTFWINLFRKYHPVIELQTYYFYIWKKKVSIFLNILFPKSHLRLITIIFIKILNNSLHPFTRAINFTHGKNTDKSNGLPNAAPSDSPFEFRCKTFLSKWSLILPCPVVYLF